MFRDIERPVPAPGRRRREFGVARGDRECARHTDEIPAIHVSPRMVNWP